MQAKKGNKQQALIIAQAVQIGLAHHQAGRLPEAERVYRQVLQVDPDHPEASHLLGVIAHQLGKCEIAVQLIDRALAIKPDYADALNNRGLALHELGRFDEALASYDKALTIQPDYAGALFNRGNVLHALGRYDEALASHDKALTIRPDYADALSNRGLALHELGRYDEALPSYDKALKIRPDYADALYNRGNALHELGRYDEALASYDEALKIQPDYADALYNQGNTLKDLGRLDEAEASYRRTLTIQPDHTDALNNLALLLNTLGEPALALNAINQSLEIQETWEAKRIFVDCVKHARFTQDHSGIRAAMVRALAEPWGRPGELARTGTDLIKLNPDIGECVARATGAWPLRLSAQDLFGSDGLTTVANDALLCTLLDAAPVCDIETERFLTMARHTLIEAATGTTASGGEVGPVLSFYGALARQCFINEYVFSYTDDEIRKAGDLRDSLVAALGARAEVPVLWPVAVAAYYPLYCLRHANRLLERLWPEAVAAVLVQQVREPEEELQIRATVPRLTNIADDVSLLVQNQYEENPYPRWVKAAPAGKAKSIVGSMCEKFPLALFERHGKSGGIDVLIAGCGTGQHSIQTAQQFQQAQVLAVDLSMASLGYAKRKSRELGLTSIEYGQADLLELGSLGRRFDVIEASGVLHHLADPWAGWRVLLSLLRPGGLMKLGLYSEVARRNIVRIRGVIAEHGYGTTAHEIRRCRQDLVDLDKSEDFGTTTRLPDFFSISTCRDLLFHVQEHRMTLTGIDAFLRENDLAFLGFEIEANVLHAYRRRFPDDRAATNLGQWQLFENENPDTFLAMYQFSIQKAG